MQKWFCDYLHRIVLMREKGDKRTILTNRKKNWILLKRNKTPMVIHIKSKRILSDLTFRALSQPRGTPPFFSPFMRSKTERNRVCRAMRSTFLPRFQKLLASAWNSDWFVTLLRHCDCSLFLLWFWVALNWKQSLETSMNVTLKIWFNVQWLGLMHHWPN